ncbi:MAG: hypothetical protein IKX96_03665 [Firmicutes bacterium]|nr:hypothetical protein [Bacillota bacterium]
MKKTLAIILALAMILSLAACGGSSSGNPSSGSGSSAVPAKPTKTVLTKASYYSSSGELNSVATYVYDEYGFVKLIKHEGPGGEESSETEYVNEYAEDYLSKRTVPEIIYEETYGPDGKILSAGYDFKDYPESSYSYVYTYNDKGLAEKYEYTYPNLNDGDLAGRNTVTYFTYDDQGRLSGMEYRYGSGWTSYENSVRYENDGKKQILFGYNDGKTPLLSLIRIYEYDDNGNKISETRYNPARSEKTIQGLYIPYEELYSDGYVPNFDHFYPSSHREYSYDENGNIVRMDYKKIEYTDYDYTSRDFTETSGYNLYEYETIEVDKLMPDLYVPEE